MELKPTISGGHAHEAAETATEIGAALQQGEVVAKALGRIFSLAPNASLAAEFTVSGAADVAVAGVSEATEIPIPTNLPTAAANVGEVVLRAARAIITKVADLQERRLPDVDLTVDIRVAPYRLTCVEIWVCRSGSWVLERKRLSITRTGPTRSGGRRTWTALTWAEAQERLADFAARSYRRRLERALREMADFRRACEGG